MCIPSQVSSFRCWITHSSFVQNLLDSCWQSGKQKTKGGGGMFFILTYLSPKKANYAPFFHMMLAWDKIHTNWKSTQKFDNKSKKKTSSPSPPFPPFPQLFLFFIFIFTIFFLAKNRCGAWAAAVAKGFPAQPLSIYGGFRVQSKIMGKPNVIVWR